MRYYEQRYPEVDELVMVQVRQIAEMGAYVKLVCISPHSFLFLFSFCFWLLSYRIFYELTHSFSFSI